MGCEMKIRIKTFNGELSHRFTKYKTYDVVGIVNLHNVVIVSDSGYECVVTLECCRHLNGGSWEIVNDAGF